MKPDPQVLKSEQLRELMGYESDGNTAKSLLKDGIPFFQGKAGPWTTHELLLLAGKRKLGLSADDKEPEQGVM